MMKRWGHSLRFELRKRPWVWPVVLLLAIGLSVGFWQQRQARTQFIQDYAGRLEKWYTPHKKAGKAEITAFKRSPAAYHQWYMDSLAVNLQKKPQTMALDGFGVRIYNDIDTSRGALSASISRTYTQFLYMKQHKIAPMYPDSLDVKTSTGDLAGLNNQSTQMVLRDNPHYYLQGWYYLWYLIRANSVILLFLVGILLTGRQWAKELANKKAHSDWLLLQGQRTLAQLGNQFSIIFYTFAQIVLLPLGLVTLGIGLGAGWGDLRYPVFGFSNPEGLGLAESFIPLRSYLFQAFGLIILLILFLTLLNMVFAQLFRNSWLTTVGLLLVVGITQVMPAIPNFPLTYFRINETITGILQKTADSDALQPQSALLNLSWWCLALLIIVLLPIISQQFHQFWRTASHRYLQQA